MQEQLSMKYKVTFLFAFILGILAVIFIDIYFRYFHIEYGSDFIKDRILPFGGLLLSMVVSALCSISYRKRILVTTPTPPIFLAFRMLASKGVLYPSLFFTFGAMFANVILSLIYFRLEALMYLIQIMPVFILLYICGVIGAVLGNILFFNK